MIYRTLLNIISASVIIYTMTVMYRGPVCATSAVQKPGWTKTGYVC